MKDTKLYMRDWTLRKVFGITLEGYNKLFELQNGCCAICGKHQTEFNQIFSVDHNHETGEVRGLLCTNCNIAIGHMHDNTDNLNAAINYINVSGPHSNELINSLMIKYEPYSKETCNRLSKMRKGKKHNWIANTNHDSSGKFSKKQ